MRITDRHTNHMTIEPVSQGDAIGLAVRYENVEHGVDTELHVTLDDDGLNLLLKDIVEIALHQQGRTAESRALCRSTDPLTGVILDAVAAHMREQP